MVETFLRVVYSTSLSDILYDENMFADEMKLLCNNYNVCGEIWYDKRRNKIVKILEGLENIHELVVCVQKNDLYMPPKLIATNQIKKNQKVYNDLNISIAEKCYGKLSIQDFEFKGKIGEGTFSSVVLAMKTSTNMKYAIKMIRKYKLSDKQIMRLKNERTIMKKMDSPFINKLHYCLQDANSLYFVMNFAERGICSIV